MVNLYTVVALVALITAVSFILFVVGYNYALKRYAWNDVKKVEEYVKATMPNEWQAYQKGSREGYEQGLRDGQEAFE